jgi:hypothetical protein
MHFVFDPFIKQAVTNKHLKSPNLVHKESYEKNFTNDAVFHSHEGVSVLLGTFLLAIVNVKGRHKYAELCHIY